MILGDNPAGHGFVLRDLVLIELFQLSHYYVMIFLSNKRRKFKLLDPQEDSPPSQFPRLVGYLDLPIDKTLRVVGLLTVIFFFQSKKFTACKIKDKKEEKIFYFLMVFNLLKIINLFESKKHLRT